MRVNESGKRSIHLHDKNAIDAVEVYAREFNCSLYSAAEKLILVGAERETNIDHNDYADKNDHDDYAEVRIDKIGSGSFIDALLNNGYEVTIIPTAGKTEMYGELYIKFRKDK